MEKMFYSCYAFDQDLSQWQVDKVQSMKWMFRQCDAFNQLMHVLKTRKHENMEARPENVL